jgi:serine phosphatase RsbU (regulator of sigma subunit)
MASRYLPAEGQLGGDWYDVFLLPEQRLGVVIGDVIGHGLSSAIVMGRMRSALRAYALEFPDPADVLTRLNAKFCHFEPDAMATVLYAVADPPYAELKVSRAGHPAPILLDGTPALAGPPDVPIGLNIDRPRHTETLRLPAELPMLMFTDGLVERRDGEETKHNLRRLAELDAGTAEEVCSRVIQTMFEESGPEDDAALIVLRRTTSA